MKHYILIIILLLSSLSLLAMNLEQFSGVFELESGNCPNRISVKKQNPKTLIITDLSAPEYETPYLWFEKINKGVHSWVTPADPEEGQRWDMGTYKRKSCFKSTLKRSELKYFEKNFLPIYQMCMFVNLEITKKIKISGNSLKLTKNATHCKYIRRNE